MPSINITVAIDTQQSFVAKILRTTKGGWICSVSDREVFLPGSQLYKDINDYESVVGRSVKVMVQRITGNSIVVSHKDYVSKIFERKRIIQNLEKGQKLVGIVKHISEKGVYIDVLGIIGFMPIKETITGSDLTIGQSIEVAVSKIDIEKSILLLSAKLFQKIVEKETREIEETSLFEKRTQALEKYNSEDDVTGTVIKKIKNGYLLELPENVPAFLPNEEMPALYRCKVGDYVDATVYDLNYDKASVYVSINKLLDKRWLKLKNLVDKNIIPNQTEMYGKVVYLERNLVTLSFKEDWGTFYGYIKNEDLAWEKVQSAADIVFLGEELKVRYLYDDNRRLYFDLKWQQEELYPQSLFDLETEDLLGTIGITGTTFIARTSIVSRNTPDNDDVEIIAAFANNIISIDPKDNYAQLVDKYTGVNITALISPKYAYGLENEKYYKFRLTVASADKRRKEHRPYMFLAELEGGALPVANPYKELVEKSFKENKTPKSNRESASYLKEIGADMYTDRDRMFYELLQNADDASSQKGVKVMVQIKGDYLIFTHDGLSFSRQDFRSIVSTANSTKRLDRKKTGYKGIGFKSVFTDSDKVYIKTGGFFFVFDKTADLFKTENFRKFYQYVNPLYTDDQLKVFFEENSEYEKEYEGVEHLPWQLLPFWVDECPQELQRTSFTRHCNVAIALNMGVTAEKYRDIIKGIIENPRFMLFLRNTRRIQLEEPVDDEEEKKKWDVISIAKQIDLDSNTTTLKNSFEKDEKEVSYIVREGNEIDVTNESFGACNIPIKKECKEIAGREKWYMYQMVDTLPVPITSIPERIIAADTTTISYAIMLDENGHSICIPDKTPSLYAYLPMEDRRYLFPFFINADFELSSNRQEAKRVSVWNEYLFYNIGKNIVSWIATIANATHSNYLSLLPQSFFIEELEEGKIDRLASQFNRGYKEALTETAFILNDRGDIVTQKDVVIDESGFADLIGADAYCSFIGTEKRMLHNNINISPLNNRTIFTEIEHVQTGELIEKILEPNNRFRLLRFWISLPAGTRALVLAHIANMPGNKKNLNDYIEDIPAYTCMDRLMSFKKLLKSDKVILRSNVIAGIEDIVEKLGIRMTDEEETQHPFHAKVEEAMIGYSIHVFNIIKSLSSNRDCPLSASEKYQLFSHFTTPKRNIDHDSLTDWGIFCNQQGNNVQLCQLTHIDSSLYNNITGQFVINEDEYSKGSRIIDRYLMKEKDQYEGIIIGKWDTLVAEVQESEEKACSLYKLASTTYTVAEHEQVKEIQAFPVTEKRFVFSKGQMHLLSEVFLNEKLSINDDATKVIELLTGKSVPSVEVSKAVKQVPFECKSQRLEDITILSDVILSQEQITVLLQYCSSNDETLFTNYVIDEKESGFAFKALSKESVVAYTNSKVLKDFINDKCSSIYLLPDEFAKYSKLRGIVTDDDLLIRILEVIGDVKEHEQVLLPIYKDSISKVKTLYISHLSAINLNENSCKEKSDINLQTLLLASSIEKPEAELFETLRNIIHITCGVTTTALSSIKLDHTIEVNGKSFPLSKLLPNEDNMAKLVDTLKERIEEFVPVLSFTNSLFGSEVDEGRADSVFEVLNKANVVLENGIQIAFVLEYAAYNKKFGIVCNVYDSGTNPVAKTLCGKWMLQYYSFANPSSILNDKYGDLGKYLTLPYSNNNIQCHIIKELSNFNCLKEKLSEEESFDLLDLVYEKSSANMVISSEDVGCLKRSLGLSGAHYVVSEYYSLQEEKLPEVIEKWRTTKDSDIRTTVLCNVFGIINEESNVVHVRKFLADGTPFTTTDKDNITSALTCNWLSGKELLINDNQYLLLQGVINDDSYFCEKDEAALSKYVSPENLYMTFSDYHIYQYDGEIPWHVKLKANNYIFHNYNEGDIALSGLNIFINGKQIDSIINLIRSLVNTGDFSTDDFFQFFEQYQSRLSGSFEGEIDDDLDSEARSAASEMAKQEAVNWLTAKGYDTSNVQTEYSFVNGVKKDGVEYHIVVKSFRSKKNVLNVNPNEWLYLLKANSRLMAYMGHMTFAVFDRKMLLGNHDFLKLRISTSNFEIENGKLDEMISRLARDIQIFERTHFVFEHIHENILSSANSLDDYNFYNTNSNEQFTAADESDII